MLHHVDIWMPEFWRLFPLACFAGSGEMWDDLLCVFWGWFKCLLALRGRSQASLPGPAEDLNLGYQAPVLHYPLEEPCPCGAHSWKICPKSVNTRSYFAWISSAEMASGNGRCFQRHQSNFCKQWKKKHSVLSSGSSHFVLFVEILQIWMYFSHKVYWEHLFRNSSLYSLHWILRPIIFACKIGEIGYFFMVKV